MYLSLSALVALSTLSFLDFAAPVLAGHSRPHRHQAASHASSILKRGAAPGLVEIPIGDLQLLRMEMTAFQEWMHSWISTANASDPATNLAQLKLEFQAYDGWMTAWLDSTLSPSPPPPLPSSIPVTASTTSSTTTASSSPTVVVVSPRVPRADASTSSEADSTTSIRVGEFFQQPSSSSSSQSAAATTLIPVFQASSSLSVVSIQLPSSSAPVTSVVPLSSAPAVAEPTTEPAVPATSPQSEGSSTFNAQSSSNLAVYYGQSPATSPTTLAQMCQDPDVDIVILAFLTTFFGPGGYPSLNLGAACAGPSPEMRSAGASGLLRCPALESDIQTCQTLGKKVLLSLGGAEATTAFSSDAQATTFATQLWDLFGAGGGGNQAMRPFGRAVLDGFDVDNEDHSTAFYSTFVSALRAAMDNDDDAGSQADRRYYISAAPQCPRPDASIPLDAMRAMDFVFVQFYNNGDCNVGQPGFEASLMAWSRDLQGAQGEGPKLYIGAPGCSACAGSGYLGAAQMAGVLQRAKAAGLSNLGGVMLWDGSEGMANREAGGKSYLSVVKAAVA
ncbi:MAG: hypothetical protein LQ344_008027 [Seirophora lacunosa]|nr:MAG: hypothetical protein LQ344_008027 [Seirophora lacunosa]